MQNHKIVQNRGQQLHMLSIRKDTKIMLELLTRNSWDKMVDITQVSFVLPFVLSFTFSCSYRLPSQQSVKQEMFRSPELY